MLLKKCTVKVKRNFHFRFMDLPGNNKIDTAILSFTQPYPGK